MGREEGSDKKKRLCKEKECNKMNTREKSIKTNRIERKRNIEKETEIKA
jgi:hypothetical protein